MSLSAILVPIAISLIASAATPPAQLRKKLAASRATGKVSLPTRFNDTDLLLKTLHEHGLPAMMQADGSIATQLGQGSITYARASADGPFIMEVSEVGDIQCLIDELDCIENEYNGNVQTYTYERIMSHMPPDMTVESEEVMDDNSIVITLNVG